MVMDKVNEDSTLPQDGDEPNLSMRVAKYRVVLKTVNDTEIEFETLDDRSMDDLVKLMEEIGPGAITQMAIEMGEMDAPMGSDYLHGFYTIDDLQQIILGIMAGLRGTNATTIEEEEHVLVVFSGWYDDSFALHDLTVWHKEEWEDFKTMVDSGVKYPVGIPLGENNGLIWLTSEDVRQQVQATDLGMMGAVFESFFEKLPNGAILNQMFEAFFENTYNAELENATNLAEEN